MMAMLFFAAFACVPRRKSTDDVEFKGMLSRVVGPRDVHMGFFFVLRLSCLRIGVHTYSTYQHIEPCTGIMDVE
jgi:hypothetical protein